MLQKTFRNALYLLTIDKQNAFLALCLLIRDKQNNIFSNCLAILSNISHSTDWHIVIFVKYVIFLRSFFLSCFLKITNFEQMHFESLLHI